jgi:glycosyltransferase involved in cell wall biosynthesis
MNIMTKEVTLFMPTMNRKEMTAIALDNLIENTNPEFIRELVIVDGSSDDGLHEHLLARLAKKTSPPPAPTVPVRLIRIKERHVVAAMQTAYAEIKTEYVAKVDSDTMVPPGWIEALHSTMKRRPELWALGMAPWREIKEVKPEERTYIPARYVGGIGLFKKEAWKGVRVTGPKYFGWNHHQVRQPWVKGWLDPSLRVFLLDSLPFEPFRSLRKLYFDKGWHRSQGEWTTKKEVLWNWKYPKWREAVGREPA